MRSRWRLKILFSGFWASLSGSARLTAFDFLLCCPLLVALFCRSFFGLMLINIISNAKKFQLRIFHDDDVILFKNIIIQIFHEHYHSEMWLTLNCLSIAFWLSMLFEVSREGERERRRAFRLSSKVIRSENSHKIFFLRSVPFRPIDIVVVFINWFWIDVGVDNKIIF